MVDRSSSNVLCQPRVLSYTCPCPFSFFLSSSFFQLHKFTHVRCYKSYIQVPHTQVPDTRYQYHTYHRLLGSYISARYQYHTTVLDIIRQYHTQAQDTSTIHITGYQDHTSVLDTSTTHIHRSPISHISTRYQYHISPRYQNQTQTNYTFTRIEEIRDSIRHGFQISSFNHCQVDVLLCTTYSRHQAPGGGICLGDSYATTNQSEGGQSGHATTTTAKASISRGPLRQVSSVPIRPLIKLGGLSLRGKCRLQLQFGKIPLQQNDAGRHHRRIPRGDRPRALWPGPTILHTYEHLGIDLLLLLT